MDGSLDKYSLNEHLFRRVPEGWLITTPVLWPIGGRVYLLSEAQKAQLVACLERWQPRIDTMSSWVNAPVLLFIIVSQLTYYDLVGALSELVGIRSEILFITIFGFLFCLFMFGPPAIQLLVARPKSDDSHSVLLFIITGFFTIAPAVLLAAALFLKLRSQQSPE